MKIDGNRVRESAAKIGSRGVFGAASRTLTRCSDEFSLTSLGLWSAAAERSVDAAFVGRYRIRMSLASADPPL